MGYAYILYVYEDGLKAKNDQERLGVAIGNALLKVCLDPSYASTPRGTERVTSEPVIHHGNCVNYVDEVHSGENQLYLWAGNCLRAIGKLPVERLNTAQQLLDNELARRKQK